MDVFDSKEWMTPSCISDPIEGYLSEKSCHPRHFPDGPCDKNVPLVFYMDEIFYVHIYRVAKSSNHPEILDTLLSADIEYFISFLLGDFRNSV